MSTNFDYYRNNKTYTSILEKSLLSDKQKYLDTVLRVTPVNGRFLDVGCGTGQIVDWVAKNQRKAYGTDISKPSIAFARLNRKGTFSLLAAREKLPYSSNYFKCVGCFNVLEHVDNVNQSLDEI